MDKLIYWLKKLGIARSATYKVKGDAAKLNEMTATDGGMIQPQKKIDDEEAKKQGKDKLPEGNEKSKVKVLFWVFAVLAGLYLLVFLSFGAFGWLIIVGIAWGFFLRAVRAGKGAWTVSFVKVLVFGLGLTVLSFIFLGVAVPDEGDQDKDVSQETVQQGKQEQEGAMVQEEEADKCDDSNSSHADFNKKEKIIVSINPCNVPWILAKEFESYTLETKKGTVLKATVWNNFVNNTEAGKSYTIRVLDVDDIREYRTDGGTSELVDEAGIAIVRWVPNKAALASAKKEVKEVVSALEY